MSLNGLIEVLKKEREFDIIDTIISNEDLFSSLKYFREEDAEEFYNEMEKFFEMKEYDNIVFNLLKLYPLTNKILKKVKSNYRLEKKEKYYQSIKNEIEEKIKEKDIDEKIKKVKEKYSEDFLNKKKIELQQEKEKFNKKQKELKKLEEEVRKFKEELFEDINNYPSKNI